MAILSGDVIVPRPLAPLLDPRSRGALGQPVDFGHKARSLMPARRTSDSEPVGAPRQRP